MQVGIITIGGRQVGVIMQGQERVDTDTPTMPNYDDRGGNSQLGDDVPGSRDLEGRAPSGIRRRSQRGSSRSGERQATPQSSDGMDAYGDGDQGKSRARERDDTKYDIARGNPFDRARFAKELDEKPWLREKVKRLSLGENKDKTANLAVIESMMNRAAVRGTSLESQAKRHRQSGLDEGGYYAGYAQSYRPEQGAMADHNIDKALMGSNVTNYATDNSSGDLARRTKENGRFTHHQDFGGKGNWESFWSPGNAEPSFRSKWQQMRRAVDKYNNPDPSVDGIAPPSMGKASDKMSLLPVNPVGVKGKIPGRNDPIEPDHRRHRDDYISGMDGRVRRRPQNKAEWGFDTWKDMRRSDNVEDRQDIDNTLKGKKRRDIIDKKFGGLMDTMVRGGQEHNSPMGKSLGIDSLPFTEEKED